ncbi:hypothetical protein LLH06_13065 [Mucilaginibacter daejeonensis]|uniref:hypothetical protein n=1 Tax=Mucilaginibacter daejeonensis TaxID=398049 RepID=UPI001D17B6C1|nr:hypothetical protein [Mucilaginibacter daejeonensis]UEG51892.1 hypothetical protein LLH06_13065 [Mucilaginibacter daejeonensis]
MKKKRWIIIGLSLLLLAISLLNIILAPIAAKKLTKLVEEKSDGRYFLKFKKLELDVFSGYASLKGIQLLHRKVQADTAALVINGTVGEIKVTGVGLLRFLLHKQLVVDSLHVDQADLSLTLRHRPASRNKKTTLSQKLSPFAKIITLGHLSLTNIGVHYRDRTGQIQRADLKRSDLEADDLLIKEGVENDTTRTLFSKSIRARIADISGSTRENAYRFSLKHGMMATKARNIQLNGIKLEPLEVMPFFKKMRTDRFQMALDSLELQELDLWSLFQRGTLQARNIAGSHGSFAVFGNPMGKRSPGDRALSFPNAVLQNMRKRINIDTVDLSHINVRYQEMKRSTGKVGTVDFLNTEGLFTHITNDHQRLLTDPWCKIQLRTMVMGKAKLSMNVNFHMNTPLYRYDMEGHMGSMSALDLNPVSVPLAGVRVTKGVINSLDFVIHGDRHKSTGTVYTRYKDIYVEMVRENNDRKFLKTLLVNTFVLEHNNPATPGKEPRYGQVSLERPLSDPFFKTIWNTLLTGFKSCIGITPPAPQTKEKVSLPKKIFRAIGDLFKKHD